ncbi:S8 family serine peptidase [Paraburkholderia sp. 1N]|uniref:S8 family serine peptidase n=1 Tax=Paraburkholderia solitsugae TaxID=2675748 RepID=A0ABX2BS61_9BURK|nr:S8 family serine peptidase [Paraburkholderia solitsugae]NPT42402.1 S8 family serine peptidase [Paraburkholderia solitsugae]
MSWKSWAGGGAWSGLNWTGRPADSACADPYLAWADTTAFAHLGGERTWVRVILELEAHWPVDGALPLTAQTFAESLEKENVAWKDWIRVSTVYRFPPHDLEASRFLTAIVARKFFTEIDGAMKGVVKRFELGMPIAPDDAAQSLAPGPQAPVPGTAPVFGPAAQPGAASTDASDQPHAVFMGVMDDGLAFAHERFRCIADNPSTRIEYFWNQDDAAAGALDEHYGRELDRDKINGLLDRCVRKGLLDEDAVYRLNGYVGARKRWAHGTEVMDLACGVRPNKIEAAALTLKGERTGTVQPPRILCVQFKTAGRTIRDTSGLWFAVHALDAIRYLLRRADDLAKGAEHSVVLNLSYGYMAGPHDGSSIIESAMDELIGLHRDLSIVVPAGNSNLLRCHATLPVDSGTLRRITWRVLPDCATPGFLEIWLPKDADTSSVTVQITPPWGDRSPVFPVKNLYTWQPGRNVLCTAVYLERVATGDRNMILIALAPTTMNQPRRDPAPAGNWTVTLTNGSGDDLEIHAWVQRNETAYGYPLRGRQSRFEDPAYKQFVFGAHVRDFDEGNQLTWIKRSGTLSSIATGEHTVVVGGYRRTDGRAATYSSTGPSLRQTKRSGPDAAAVSEDSVACAGVLGASTRSGCLVALSGTSAAAPQVARLLARQKIIAYANGLQPNVFTPQLSARAWVAHEADSLDPVPDAPVPHLLGPCFGTLNPPPVPIPQHAYVPRPPEIRTGSGRLPSPRWKKRGIKL